MYSHCVQVCEEVFLEKEVPDILQTFQLMSDGKILYWLYALQSQETVAHPVMTDKVKQHPIILQALHFKVHNDFLNRQFACMYKGEVISKASYCP